MSIHNLTLDDNLLPDAVAARICYGLHFVLLNEYLYSQLRSVMQGPFPFRVGEFYHAREIADYYLNLCGWDVRRTTYGAYLTPLENTVVNVFIEFIKTKLAQVNVVEVGDEVREHSANQLFCHMGKHIVFFPPVNPHQDVVSSAKCLLVEN